MIGRGHRALRLVGASLLIAPLFAAGCISTDVGKYEEPKRDMSDGADLEVPQPDMTPDAEPDPDMKVEALALTSIEPIYGPLQGGTRVTLRGAGFVQGVKVSFGESLSPEVSYISATQLEAVTPSADAAGAVDVVVTGANDQRATLSAGFTYIEAQPAQIYCQLQAESPVSVQVNQPTPALHAQIAFEGVTNGDGQGPGLVVELGQGAGADFSTYSFVAMSYARDKDGVALGDKAKDEYEATLSAAQAGTYRYVARVKRAADGDDAWLYCDLDGSANGTSPEQLGTLEVLPERTPEITYCQLQPQSPLVVKPGQDSGVLNALVYAAGVTQGAGQGAQIEGELGYGANAADYASFTFVPMTYDGDKDGPVPADQANDQYGAKLNIAAEGTYRYVARFRFKDQGAAWFYCDLDGHVKDMDPFEPEQAGEVQVLADPPPSISFCQTETVVVSARPGQPSPEITARVFASGITEGTGAGAGVTGQLVWGPANQPPSQWLNSVTATYKEDVDGLVVGDKANDRFSAQLQSATQGDFGYAFRFSLDGGQTYARCDTDGNSPASFDPTKVGSFSVQANNYADGCTLQFPNLLTHAVKGSPVEFYGRVFEAGVTDVSDGDAMIKAELVVGPVGADPLTEPMRFTSYPATFKSAFADKPDEDEYQAAFTPSMAGLYQYFYRFSVDGGVNYVSCDMDGAAGQAGFEADHVGVLAVEDAAVDRIDYCHVFQSGVVDSVANMMDSPIFTMEVYKSGITANNGGANSRQLEAEVGVGPRGANPGLPGLYTWSAAPYARVMGNNYEYEVVPYMTTPSPGDYSVVGRVRRAGDMTWTYCDNFNQTMDYLQRFASTLQVVP